jgi:Reverse transcriptase (RNA-dependent DNA polymerase)
VACGYCQIPGIDVNESFAPVINDVRFRIILIAKIMWGLQASIIDVETAFLHGKLSEEIYMNAPDDMNVKDNKCLRFKKTVYGLVQNAREFYTRLICELKDLGFTENKSDQCLLSKGNQSNIMIIGIYVDDCLVLGKEQDINKLIVDLELKGCLLKVERNLKDYLSCWVIEDINKRKILILQPHLINKLIEKFGDELSVKRIHGTPGHPRFKITRPDQGSDTIPENLQKNCRSKVGMLLYLIKYSRPDISNAMRELSKCMDRATYGTYQEMFRVVKFVLDTKNYCLKIQPNFDSKNCKLKIVSDSDWTGDPETRISVTGFIVYLQTVPVCWH